MSFRFGSEQSKNNMYCRTCGEPECISGGFNFACCNKESRDKIKKENDLQSRLNNIESNLIFKNPSTDDLWKCLQEIKLELIGIKSLLEK